MGVPPLGAKGGIYAGWGRGGLIFDLSNLRLQLKSSRRYLGQEVSKVISSHFFFLVQLISCLNYPKIHCKVWLDF